MFGHRVRQIARLRACIDQIIAERDSARRERDAYQRAATAEQGRADALEEMLAWARADCDLARRAGTRALRDVRETRRSLGAALRRIDRLRRAVARYRAEYSRPSQQEREVAR